MCSANAGEGRRSTCGSYFNASEEEFPSVPYSASHFNDDKCTTASGNIENYQDIYQVRFWMGWEGWGDCAWKDEGSPVTNNIRYRWEWRCFLLWHQERWLFFSLNEISDMICTEFRQSVFFFCACASVNHGWCNKKDRETPGRAAYFISECCVGAWLPSGEPSGPGPP